MAEGIRGTARRASTATASRLTNLDKVLYPETGTTKGEVIGYYAAIAPGHAPARRSTGRPRASAGCTASARRMRPARCSSRRTSPTHAPDWVRASASSSTPTHANTYPLVERRGRRSRGSRSWRRSRSTCRSGGSAPTARARNPDRLVLDLDPGPRRGPAPSAPRSPGSCATILARHGSRRRSRSRAAARASTSTRRSTGRRPREQVSEVAHELARALEADHPDLIVSEHEARRCATGKVLIDWSQNNGNKTTIAPYSLRGRLAPDGRGAAHVERARRPRPRATSSASRGAGTRGRHVGVDPIADRCTRGSPAARSRDRLATYRSKRDAGEDARAGAVERGLRATATRTLRAS